MSISDLYSTYAAMEQLPIDARAAEAVAKTRRLDTLAGLDKRASYAKEAAEAAKGKLQTELRSEAQAATSKGAIPKSGTVASGSQPNFIRMRSLREKVEGLLVEKARAVKDLDRLLSDLQTLERQISEERRTKGVWARGQRADVITYCIAGLGLLLSIIFGPVLPGVAILVVALAIAGYRLRDPSAMMMRATQKCPALGSRRKYRLGYILSLCGWAGIFSLILNAVLPRALNASRAGLGFDGSSRLNIDSFWVVAMLCLLAAVVVGHRIRRGT